MSLLENRGTRAATLRALVGSVFLAFSPISHAVEGTYQGLLISDGFDAPISVEVKVKETFGLFSGRVKTAFPVVGEGPVVGGENDGRTCNLTSQLGRGMRLRLEGSCTPTTLKGRYRLYLPDNRRVLGTFDLKRLDSEQETAKSSNPSTTPSAPPTLTMSACLRANGSCLSTCPRATSDDQSVCVNTCARKFSQCKTKSKGAMDGPG